MKTFTPRSIKSNWAMVENRGVEKNKTIVPWERRKNIPTLVKSNRKSADAKAKHLASVEMLRDKLNNAKNAKKVMLVKKTGKTFKLIGQGKSVGTFDEAKTIAKNAGYTHVRFATHIIDVRHFEPAT